MFFTLSLEHEILLHPQYFGPGMRRTVENRLYEEVEGTCQGLHGYIVTVLQILKISEGRVLPGRGHVLFKVTYKGLMFRPMVNEVVDAIVLNVLQEGILAEVGTVRLYIAPADIPGMTFDGSMQPPSFVSDDHTARITIEDTIRVRISGVKFNAQRIDGTATLAGDYLGALQNERGF